MLRVGVFFRTMAVVRENRLSGFLRGRSEPGGAAKRSRPLRTQTTNAPPARCDPQEPRQAASQTSHDPSLMPPRRQLRQHHIQDRKSTRLNSSHVRISYAVFCLKKKKQTKQNTKK